MPPVGPPKGVQPSIDVEAARELAAGLRTEASRIGFSRVGFAPAVDTPRHERFTRWLADGLAGAMQEWLVRHEPMRRHPASLLAGARTVVMLATDYSTVSAEWTAPDAPGHGKVARYAWGDDYHDLLRERVNALATWLLAAAPGCTARGVVDSAPISEREFARLAGLGWFGKNTMLISPEAGSWFFLTALLTDLELPTDAPIEVDHCGSCTACLDACPTGALVAPRVLDARKCTSSLTIEDHGPIDETLRGRLDGWIFGCDICQEVCPWNRHAAVSAEPSFAPRGEERTLPLAEILSLDEEGFRRRFKGSPILRAKRRGLLRSAAIALGHAPDPAAADALAKALRDHEPVVREAAAWALGRWVERGVMADWARGLLESAVQSSQMPS
jgi:epoxyqueuosine reductase